MRVEVVAKDSWNQKDDRTRRFVPARTTVWLTLAGDAKVRPGHTRPKARPKAQVEMTLDDGTYRSFQGKFAEATMADPDGPTWREVILLDVMTLVDGPSPEHQAQTTPYRVLLGTSKALRRPLESAHG